MALNNAILCRIRLTLDLWRIAPMQWCKRWATEDNRAEWIKTKWRVLILITSTMTWENAYKWWIPGVKVQLWIQQQTKMTSKKQWSTLSKGSDRSKLISKNFLLTFSMVMPTKCRLFWIIIAFTAWICSGAIKAIIVCKQFARTLAQVSVQ